MSGQILCDVLPLPKRHIIGRLHDSRTELLRMIAMPIDILKMHMHVMVDFIAMRRMILASRCSHHERALTDRELSVHHCAIGSRCSQTLGKPERTNAILVGQAAAEGDPRPGPEAPARPDERFPLRAGRLQQEDFHLAARGPAAAQPDRQHLRVVEHEHVPRAEIFRQIAEDAVLERAGVPVQHQQARTVARPRRRLRDKIARKCVIEFGEPEAQRLNASFVVAGRLPPFTSPPAGM